MARRSDARDRMVDAGQDLLSRYGYGVTLLDVVEKAGAPRGSIYYHFPNGKEQLAIEVALKTTSELERLVASVARRKDDVVEFLQGLVEHHAKRFVTSEFSEGCPLMAITVSAGADSPALAAAADTAFTSWVAAIATALRGKGVDPENGERIASAVVSGVEGALVLGRATRSRTAFDHLKESLPALAGTAVAA